MDVIARLLCPGPSLAHYRPGPADFVVGVNRAATRLACDVWACGDRPLIQQERFNVIGLPLLLTGVDGEQQVRDWHRSFPGETLWGGECMCWAKMLDYCPPDYTWTTFSATAALVYCGWRGAKQIDVYGSDWSGTADFDGTLAGKNRSEDRWALERQIWQNLTEWLARKGANVIKHHGND